MTIPPHEAAQALAAVERTQSRSATLRGYRGAAPHLILWGILWAIGYGLTDFFPARAGAVWTVIVLVGTSASLAGFLRQSRVEAGRYLTVTIALAAFCLATFAVFKPADPRPIAAFIPLLIATAYVIGGLWLGARFVVAGLAVAALTLAGFFLLPAHFLLWMAGIGGGALVLTGLWLRRA